MPQEPKKRKSKSRSRIRRASKILKALMLVSCSNCQKLTLSHEVCKHCGFYGSKSKIKSTEVKVVKT